MIIRMLLTGGLSFFLLYGRIPALPLTAGCVCLGLSGIPLRRRKHRHHGADAMDRRARLSRLSHWNAGLKLCFSVGCALLCIGVNSIPFSLTVLAAMTLLAVAVGGAPLGEYLSLLTLPAAFILLGTLAVLFEISPLPLGLLDLGIGNVFLSVTPESQLRALSLLAKALGAVSCLYLLSLTTPMHSIIAALRAARIPAVVVELMYLIYRYLFILAETQSRMSTAARSRFGYRNARATLRTALSIAPSLFLASLRRASDSFAAMESRCYDGQIRFLERETPLRAAHAAAAAGCFSLLALLGWGWRG